MTVTMELADGEIRVVKDTDEEDGETSIRIEGLNPPSHWLGCERR